MTLPYEEKLAINNTREFLKDLAGQKLGEIRHNPREVREKARRLLRHYPWEHRVEKLFGGEDV
jgi:hypothetical protein